MQPSADLASHSGACQTPGLGPICLTASAIEQGSPTFDFQVQPEGEFSRPRDTGLWANFLGKKMSEATYALLSTVVDQNPAKTPSWII